MSNRRRRGFAVPASVRLRESTAVEVEPEVVEADSAKPGSDRKLRTYWVRGEGAAKIRWGEPNDFDRCVTHLGKYVADPKGLCAEYHHEALGVWPGQEFSPKKESATPATAPHRVTIAEATTGNGTTLTPTAGSRRYRARLIETPRWGSSGYYSSEVVGRDGPKIFPVGTHLYADHPGMAEETDRPERSIRDLAARTVSPAVMETDGLYADIEVFPHAAPLIESLADSIGLSIRASGLAEAGTVDGRSGPVITAFTEGYSIDFVTRAGAGGKLVSLLESARQQLTEARNVGAWLESRLHLALTQLGDDMYGDGRLTRDERITLSGAIGDALTAWTQRVEADAPQLFTRDLWDDPEPTDTPVVEAAATPTDPAPPAESGPHTSDGAPPSANPPTEGMPSMSGAHNSGSAPGAQAGHTPAVADGAQSDLVVSEAKRTVAEMQLAEAKTQADGLRTQLAESQKATALAEARADKAEAELRQVKAVEAARAETARALSTSDLPDPAKTRVVEAVTRNVPLTDTGLVDTTALTAAITAAVESERQYIASVSESAGAGTPSGLGSVPAPLTESTTATDPGAWETATAARLARIGGYNTAATAGKAG